MKLRKAFAFILALVLVLGIITPAMAAPQKQIEKWAKNKTIERFEGKSISRDKRAKGIEDSDEVRIIVELENDPALERINVRRLRPSKLTAEINQIAAEMLAEQDELVSQIEKNGIAIDIHQQFVNVVNGFSCTTTFAEAKKIEGLPGVKRVVLANKYSRPEPDLETSKQMVQAPQTWEVGYKGEGMVIAIIDTGIDYTHKDMVLSEGTTPKLTEEKVAELIANNNLPGEWYTEKVPYGYNYADNNHTILDLGPGASMHGMHVAGIAAANGDEANGGIKGVAPEAQVLAMKVFSNDQTYPYTWGDLIIKAIDDAVALGADVINMSLGSSAAFVMPDDPEQQAVTRAANAGVLVAVSAGNSNHIGDGYDNPYIANPDIGVVGAPGLTPESIQVASVENTHIKLESMECTINDPDTGEEETLRIAYQKQESPDPVETFGNMPMEVVYVGDGRPEQYEGKDVTGKVVLVVRTGNYYYANIQHTAEDNGAAGVIVRGHVNHGDYVNMALDFPTIPMVSLSIADGNMLAQKASEGKTISVVFDGKTTTVPNPLAGEMSDFSSWGVTPNLDFKPEITAPGNPIYSTLNDDEYGNMGGTSMAAPHVAGGGALVLGKVDKEFGLAGINRAEMAKNLLMSTAKPVMDQWGYYISPRKQGAGIMNLLAATTTPAIVYDSNTGLSKVNLKEIGDPDNEDYTETFTLTVENFSDHPVTYQVSGAVFTDAALEYIDGDASYLYNFLSTEFVFDADSGEMPITFSENEITVPANSSTEVEVTVDLNNAVTTMYYYDLFDDNFWSDEQSLAAYPNGTFVEGYIHFTPVLAEGDDVPPPELSIPYIGFYGDWNQAPVIDVSIYDDDPTNANNSFYGVTTMAWLSEEEDMYYFLGYTPEGPDKDMIGFSPNGDGVADSAVPLLSFLRNAKTLDIDILDENGNKLRDLASKTNIRKNLADGSPYAQFTSDDAWTWDGTANNKLLPDGQYIYRITTQIDFEGAEPQILDFPVYIDTQAPVIEPDGLVYDAESKKVTVKANDGANPILAYELYVDGEFFAESSDGIFDLSDLSGAHTAYVRVLDRGWNTAETEEIVVGDTTVPSVYMDYPEAFGIYNTRDVYTSGAIVDVSGLQKLQINGNDVPFTYDPETNACYFETTLHYEKDAAYMVDVTAVDNAGNEINFERKIFVDATAPVVDVDVQTAAGDPVERVVESAVDKVYVSPTVTENFPDLKVIVNGNEVFNNEVDWSYDNLLKPIQYPPEGQGPALIESKLDYGDNLITVEAQDAAGNVTRKEVKVYRKQEGEPDPVFDIPVKIETVELSRLQDVSSDRPIDIHAAANQEADWQITITDPNGESAATFTGKGEEITVSWQPEEIKKLNGTYTVNITATAGDSTDSQTASFEVYNYPVKIKQANVIQQNGYIAIEAVMENLGPVPQNPMLVIQVTDEQGHVINISTAQMDGLMAGQTVKLSSGFGTPQEGRYQVDIYVWSGWEDPESLASPQTASFSVE